MVSLGYGVVTRDVYLGFVLTEVNILNVEKL